LEDVGVEGKIILRWIFSKWDVEAWIGLIWLRIGLLCTRVNEPSGSINAGNFLTS